MKPVELPGPPEAFLNRSLVWVVGLALLCSAGGAEGQRSRGNPVEVLVAPYFGAFQDLPGRELWVAGGAHVVWPTAGRFQLAARYEAERYERIGVVEWRQLASLDLMTGLPWPGWSVTTGLTHWNGGGYIAVGGRARFPLIPSGAELGPLTFGAWADARYLMDEVSDLTGPNRVLRLQIMFPVGVPLEITRR